jgi:dihydrofolate reductase
VSIFGADVARQVLALGRLDEIIVHIVPLILGGGVRLFGEAQTPQVRLERTYIGTSGTLTDIRFRVAARRQASSGSMPLTTMARLRSQGRSSAN